MIAVGFLVVSFYKHFLFVLLGFLHRNVHVVTNRVLTIVDDISFDASQHAVVEVQAMLGEEVLNFLQCVVAQIVVDTQAVWCRAIINPAIRQLGQKLIRDLQLSRWVSA